MATHMISTIEANANIPDLQDDFAASTIICEPSTPRSKRGKQSTPSFTPPSNLIIKTPRSRIPTPKAKQRQQEKKGKSALLKEGSQKTRPNKPKKQTVNRPPSGPRFKRIAAKAPKASHTVPRRSSSVSSMSSARRQPRSGARSGPHDGGEETQVWRHIHSQLQQLRDAESRAKVLRDEIVELESKIKGKLTAKEKPREEDFDSLDSLYREQVRIAEEQKAFLAENLPGMEEKIGLLGAIVRGNEDETSNPQAGRGGSSRSSAFDFDGPSDSPGPTAENKHVRKIANNRTGSIPPKASEVPAKGDTTPIEAPERIEKKPKVVFAVGEEVAFKRKIPGKLEEQDWIQGKVTRVIGEGKSRRYDVQDPFPEGAVTKPGEFTYKSSASQMVPIPAQGTQLGDYEVGRAVLALYPETTTFYRAEVKAMLDDGANVQLLFEDEAAGALKVVERRMVLDHKG